MPALTKPNAIQRTRLEQSQATWQPPGTTIELHGRSIPGGMLYVGSHVTGLHKGSPVEPALIDPKYKSRQREGYSYSHYNYWQLLSYHKLTPIDRASYLDWLAAGRPENATYQQVLLFLFGIERRILFDARYDEQAIAEIPVLLDEVDRVVRGYRDYSFSSLRLAASNLRIAGGLRLPDFDPTSIDPPRRNEGWSMPLAIEVALGTFALEQRPLPAKWAYSWAVCSPYAHLNTVEHRCPEEFAEYFAARYHQIFGEGIVLPDRNYGSPLTYQPLSPSFQRALQVGPRALPATGSVSYSYPALTELIRTVSTELEPFARAIYPGHSGTPLSAYGLLPESMGSLDASPRIVPLKNAFAKALQDRSSVLIEKSSLLSFFPEIAAAPTPTQATGISQLLARLGYGIEPDPATMRTPFLRAERIGAYRIEYGSENYYQNLDLFAPLALLSMWSYAAASDGPIAEQTGASACALLVSGYDLQPFEINRLQAYAAWLTQHPASLNDARRRFGLAGVSQGETAALTLVAMSSIDATMNPTRIKALVKLYGILGLTSEQLHADIHRVSTWRGTPSQIIDGAPGAGFSIPAAPDPHRVVLDTDRVAAVREQTESISTLLHGVFAGNPSSEGPIQAAGAPTATIDPYQLLLEHLAKQPAWSLRELSLLAEPLGLMTTGAIETLNDRAAALGLEPLLDCDDESCDVSPETLPRMQNGG